MQWRMLVVEDDKVLGKQIGEWAERGKLLSAVGKIACDVQTDFAQAMELFEHRRFDFVVLDVRGDPGENDEEAGVQVFEEIKKRAFVPVVFYTAVPDAVRSMEAAVVRVVEKTQGLTGLGVALAEVYATGLPELRRHLAEEERAYLWDFVSQQKTEAALSAEGGVLAYLFARRLARLLARQSVRRFLASRGIGGSSPDDDAVVQPVEMYILPPLGDTCLAGDLVHDEERNEYWIVLTPSCDLEQGKADHVLLAGCHPLATQKESTAFCSALERGETPSNTATAALTSLLTDNRKKHQADRFKFLPGVLHFPDLVVDLQRLSQVPIDCLKGLTRVASVDAPFSEALISRFSRYYGRIGTPDLETSSVLDRLRNCATAGGG